MSNDKALAIVPKTFTDIQTMAEAFSKSALLPDALKGKVPDLVFQIAAGHELGLSPVASIRGIHIIQGKPVLASDTMVALCLGSGLCEYFTQIEATQTSVTYETKRKGSPHVQRCTWTIEDAKRAALHQKDTWRAHPRQMLASRCRAELARSAYPDVLAGCYDPDELSVPAKSPTPSAGQPIDSSRSDRDVVDVEFVESTDDHADVVAIDAMETVESLKAHGAVIAALKLIGPAAMRASDRYKARMAILKAKPTAPEAA